jgi:hypothetical protein
LKEHDIVPDEDDGGALILEEEEPSLYNEARTCESKFKWNAAIKQGHSIVDCKWVYKLKDDLEEEKKKFYKARLVAKGFT